MTIVWCGGWTRKTLFSLIKPYENKNKNEMFTRLPFRSVSRTPFGSHACDFMIHFLYFSRSIFVFDSYEYLMEYFLSNAISYYVDSQFIFHSTKAFCLDQYATSIWHGSATMYEFNWNWNVWKSWEKKHYRKCQD